MQTHILCISLKPITTHTIHVKQLAKGLELGRESKAEEDHHLEEGELHLHGTSDSKVMDIETENMNKPLLQISTQSGRPEIRTQAEAVPRANNVRAR